MPRAFALQYDIIWEDKDANHCAIEDSLAALAPAEGSLVILPEMFDTGFSMNVDRLSEQATGHASEKWAAETARKFRVYIQAASIQRPHANEKATNNAVVFDPSGGLICRYEKIFPFSGGREPESYRGGAAIQTFQWGGLTVCPLICYDLRFPELWRLAVLDHGAEVFTIGASWPAARHAHWLKLLDARAIENQAYIIAVNRCGRDPYLEYAGGSKIVDPRGEVMTQAGDTPAIISAEVDREIACEWRSGFAALRDARRELLGRLPQ